jgi:hypothetical protein
MPVSSNRVSSFHSIDIHSCRGGRQKHTFQHPRTMRDSHGVADGASSMALLMALNNSWASSSSCVCLSAVVLSI